MLKLEVDVDDYGGEFEYRRSLAIIPAESVVTRVGH